MAVFNEPQKWAQTLGKDADVVRIPNIAGDTDPSIDKIFPAVFSVPLAHGGRAIPRNVLNGLFKLLGDWSFYQQNGGIASYSNTFDYAVGSCVKYNNEFYRCIQANGASSTVEAPTNSAYWSKIPTLADLDEISFKTGDIKIHTTSTVPNGWLLCNGASISRSTFSNLFSKIGTTYGKGDGSTTFNIPDLRDRYIIGANTNVLGTKVEEQLPNIKGYISARWNASGGALRHVGGGAFSLGTEETVGNLTQSSSGTASSTLYYNQHIYSSTYVDSGKVYPLSLALNFIIKF